MGCKPSEFQVPGVNHKRFLSKGNFQHLSNGLPKFMQKADSIERNILADGRVEKTLCKFTLIYNLMAYLAN